MTGASIGGRNRASQLGVTLVCVATLSLAALGCAPSGHTTLEECELQCRGGVAAGCLTEPDCRCTQDRIDLANACVDTMGCGPTLDAINDCVNETHVCDARCAEYVEPYLRCVNAFCMADRDHECCVGPPPATPSIRAIPAGSTVTLEDTLEPTDMPWSVAPITHELPRACPLEFSLPRPQPHHAYAFRAEGGPLVLNLSIERPDGVTTPSSNLAMLAV